MESPVSVNQLPRLDGSTLLRGRRVLLRAGLNVPTAGGKVRNDFRIRRALPTMQFLREQGARVVILAHIGRDAEDSLHPVFEYLQQYFPLSFVSSVVDDRARSAIEALKDGDAVMLENVRRHPEEVQNDEDFAEQLASLADVYVNDAFAASHREHASIVGVPEHIPAYAGMCFVEEVETLGKAFAPQSPSALLLGGAKFETKEPLVRKFLDIYDTVFVGGALAHTFYEARGWNIGKSLRSEQPVDVSDLVGHEKLLLPRDVIVERGGRTAAKEPSKVAAPDTIYDAGPETVAELTELVKKVKFVLWNGPLGNYEKGFNESTETLAEALAESSSYSIVGGGDTVASISQLNIEDKFSFVSTGGGAMLQFLIDGTLPGMKALQRFV